MKSFVLFILLLTPAIAGTAWTHKTIEGEGGGINGDYFFYQSFRPKSGSDVMGILKARAVYGFEIRSEKPIVVADYSFTGHLHIQISHADRKDAETLFSGEEVNMKTVRDYKIPSDMIRGGMITPKKGTKLTQVQQEDLFNLIHVLGIQRCTPRGGEEKSAVNNEASRKEDGTNTTWTSMGRIDGTTLSRSDMSTKRGDSEDITRTCTIGYFSADGENEKFVTVLTLPSIKNDSFEIKVVNGKLKVTAKNADRMIVSFNLRNLVPSLLSE